MTTTFSFTNGHCPIHSKHSSTSYYYAYYHHPYIFPIIKNFHRTNPSSASQTYDSKNHHHLKKTDPLQASPTKINFNLKSPHTSATIHNNCSLSNDLPPPEKNKYNTSTTNSAELSQPQHFKIQPYPSTKTKSGIIQAQFTFKMTP